MLSQLSADEAQRLASEASVDDPRLTKLQAYNKISRDLILRIRRWLSSERAREADQAARMAVRSWSCRRCFYYGTELLGRESSRARLREEARSAGGLASQQQGMIASQRSQRARDAMAAKAVRFGMQTGAESMRQGRRSQALQTAGLGDGKLVSVALKQGMPRGLKRYFCRYARQTDGLKWKTIRFTIRSSTTRCIRTSIQSI